MSLLEKMKKTGYKKVTDRTKMVVDAVNDIFGDLVPTNVPAFNIAISGKYNGGVGGGLVSIAGPSKHFKTLFCLLAASAYMNHHEDAIMLYYDSEGGASLEYLKMMNIPVDRVVHIPIENVEELSFDMMQKLDSLTEKEKVFVMIDSVGNLASKKELTDALNEKSVADMTRAKALKGFFRMVTPIIKRLNIPFYAIQHTYLSLSLFPTDVVSGGTGGVYSSDTVLIIGKRQVKDGKELIGNEFVLKAEKSRFIKEKSAIPVTVLFDGGLYKQSSLFEWACELGYVDVPAQGWYIRTNVPDDKKWRKKEIETNSEEFFKPIVSDPKFIEGIEAMYKLGSSKSLDIDQLDDITEKYDE